MIKQSAWAKFVRTDGQSPESRQLITLRGSSIAFNSHFIRANKLQEYSRVTLFCDSQNYRIGFHFHSDISDKDSFALCTDGGSKKTGDGRIAQVSALIAQHRWIKANARLKEQTMKKYTPQWSSVDRIWFISIRPSFENKVTSTDQIEAGLKGIYRYWASGQIVYIGRGDIKSRGNVSSREDWPIDEIEFSVIAENEDQEKWESAWLDEFRNQHGVWPFYNRIGGKKADI